MLQDKGDYFLDGSFVFGLDNGMFFFFAINLDRGAGRQVSVKFLFPVGLALVLRGGFLEGRPGFLLIDGMALGAFAVFQQGLGRRFISESD